MYNVTRDLKQRGCTNLPPVIAPEILGRLKLLHLADVVERTERYSQYRYTFDCGTPACALGHWAAYCSKDWQLGAGVGSTGRKDSSCDGQADAEREFALTASDRNSIFGLEGCAYAGRNNHRAADYIRRYVARTGK